MVRTRQPASRISTPPAPITLRLSAQGRLRRCALLSGMGFSLVALMAAPERAEAAGPAFGTPAWAASRGAVAGGGSPATVAGASGVDASTPLTTPEQALARTQRSMADLSRAAAQIAAAQSAQTAAIALAASIPNTSVPNGLTAGGLVVAVDSTNTPLLTNAQAPTQTTKDGKVEVTVTQIAQKAIVGWSSFNVGQNTTLHFDQTQGTQTDGSNNWVVLNRITDPSAKPSQILGQIKAEGSVYLLNNNGIVFGAGSQVNTHSLLASTLNLFSNDTATSNQVFLDPNQGIANFAPLVQYKNLNGTDAAPTQTALINPGTADAAITLERGARISSGALGQVIIAAPTIGNAGSITSDDGQAIVYATRNLQFSATTTSGTRSDFLLNPSANVANQTAGTDDTGTRLVNSGLIRAARGNVSAYGGSQLDQGGIVLVTTSTIHPGSISLQSSGLASFAAGTASESITAILPDTSDVPLNSSAASTAAFKPGSISVSARSVRFSAGSLVEAPGAVLNVSSTATDGVGSITKDLDGVDYIIGRTFLDRDSVLDVAGLADVQLAHDANLVAIPRIGQNELADSPTQRNGALFRQQVVIDSTISGTRSDGTPWVGSPILNARGYTDAIQRDIRQLLVNAGSITITAPQIITQQGSLLNLDGGYLHVLPGTSGGTSRLQTADGHLFDISRADPQYTYAGFAGQYVERQARFGITRTYVDPLISGRPAPQESGYIVGADAGTLSLVVQGISASQPGIELLAGDITARAYVGRRQIESGNLPQTSGLGVGNRLPSGGTLKILTDGALVLQDAPVALSDYAPAFDAATPVTSAATSPQDSSNVLYWTPLSNQTIAASGFANLAVTARQQILVKPGQGLQVQDGGSITLSATRTEVGANLTAASGRISIRSDQGAPDGLTFRSDKTTRTPNGDIVINDGVVLNAAGRFVNDGFLPADAQSGSALVNGGSVALTILASTTTQDTVTPSPIPIIGQPTTTTTTYDSTGSIKLGAGSLIDVSSGGYVNPTGALALSNGLPRGKGGDVSLIVAPLITGGSPPTNSQLFGALPRAQADGGRIIAAGSPLNTHLDGYGFQGGGTLSLRALGVQVGGDSSLADGHEALYLDPSFFAGQGFASYAISGAQDIVISADTRLLLRNANYLTDFRTLLTAPTGTALRGTALQPAEGTGLRLGTLDDIRRTPTNLSLSAGDYLSSYLFNFQRPRNPDATGSALLDTGSAIVADAGASVSISARNQLTVLGSITAHGGKILLSADSEDGSQATYGYGGAGAGNPYSSLSKSVWLGAEALLDASGISLIDPLAAPVRFDNGQLRTPRTGRVLGGGSVTLTDDTGSIIALDGAMIDVRGTSDRFDFISATGSPVPGLGFRYVSSSGNVFSDGGSITLGASGGLLFDGHLQAAGGSTEARGGSLRITAEQARGNTPTLVGQSPDQIAFDFRPQSTSLIIQNSGDVVPVGLRPGDEIGPGIASPLASSYPGINNVQSGVLNFSADRINGAGFDSVQLGTDGALSRNSNSPFTIAFSGSVSLQVPGSITLAANRYLALPAYSATVPSTAPSDTGAVSVALTAGYVNIGGNSYNNKINAPISGSDVAAGDASLNIQAARGLDVTGSFSLANFAQSRLFTNGDMRFLTPVAQDASSDISPAPLPGLLFSTGSLDLAAAQFYPASGNRFIIEAASPNRTNADGSTQPVATTIRFLQAGDGTAAMPLSAGGQLLVDANVIEQQGTLRAPAGSIILGVRDANDAATQAQFAGAPVVAGTLPLISTDTVKLAANSITSVSLDGFTVPFGFTVDGQRYQYDAIPNGALRTADSAVLSSSPAKQIELQATSVIGSGGTIDLSGGGDLLAQEFVPGTGGTRDVLARRYADTSGTGTVSLFANDSRPIYAILPGSSLSALGAYDPAFDTLLTGAVAGQASGPLVGKSVHLTGVGNLKDGDYVLLPARYAVLPGAYRLVQNTSVTDALAARNAVLPDGSYLSAGYFADGITRLDGSAGRDARTTSFLVQSNPVWQQYSQYTLSGANDYFTTAAAKAGVVASERPQDAGRLVLAAGKLLDISSQISASAQDIGKQLGRQAQVDITGPDIQLLGGSGKALDGYLQIGTSTLDSLASASLLIGGTRTRTSAGDLISASANSVVVSNDAASPIETAELILATRLDPNLGTAAADAVAQSTGVRLDAGSVIKAAGNFDAGRDAPITTSGDGTLLRISNGAPVTVTRSDVTSNGGKALLELLDGARVDGGQALTLDSSGDVRTALTSSFVAHTVDANAAAISFVADGAAIPESGLVLGSQALTTLGAADAVRLRSRATVSFIGAVDATTGSVGDLSITLPGALTLSGSGFSGNGGAVGVSSRQLDLVGSAGDAAAASAGNGSLSVETTTLSLDSGNASFSGFSAISAQASGSIIGNGSGRFDFGAATVTLATPQFAAATRSDTRLTTTGALTLSGAATPTTTAATMPAAIGGQVSISANGIDVDTQLAARAGTLSLSSGTGDLSFGSKASLNVAGVDKAFFDVTRAADAGTIVLDTGTGSLHVDPASRFDVSGASAGGDAGLLQIKSAGTAETLSEFGVLRGAAAAGKLGGSLALDTVGSVDLDALALALTNSGITGSISVHTHAGNLALAASNALKAGSVSLIADAADATAPASAESGNVLIAGTIDASGVKGGTIALSGRSGVDVEGSLIATGSSKDQRGGTVILQTSGIGDGTVNATYGYQNVSAADAGTITLGSAARINVSGGSAGGLSNGAVAVRAPLLATNDLNLAVDSGATITGARSVDVEAFAVWNTTDASTGAQHFNGTIDPLAQSTGTFYTTTLASFVSQPAFAFESRLAGLSNLHVHPGIELRNDSGNIVVANAWNLGAATLDAQGNIAGFTYRHEGEAPVLTLRASGSLFVNASLTDGFAQLANPLGLQAARLTTYEQAKGLYDTLTATFPTLGAQISPPKQFPSGDANEIAQYYGLYEQYMDFLLYRQLPVGSLSAPVEIGSPATDIVNQGISALALGAPRRPNDPEGYANYLVQYASYLDQQKNSRFGGRVALPSAPNETLAPVFTSAAIGGPVDNSASPVATSNNPLPIASAVLVGGASTSFRLVAGGDAGSADPLSLQPLAALQETGTGNLIFDGQTVYKDPVTNNTAVQGTTVRTGTGSITIAVGRDLSLQGSGNASAPGTIYTAGAPIAGRLPNWTARLLQSGLHQDSATASRVGAPDLIVTGTVQSEAAGDLHVIAQKNITGAQAAFSDDLSDGNYSTAGQYWWEWMQTGNDYTYTFGRGLDPRAQTGLAGSITGVTATSINFGSFGQGLLSTGGNVVVDAGGSISKLSVSLPTTWYLSTIDDKTTVKTIGGGDLSVKAGADILGGAYFVSQGQGTIRAGNDVGSALRLGSTEVGTILALQDAQVDLRARGSINLAGAYNPSYLPSFVLAPVFVSTDSQSYGRDSQLSVTSASGDIRFGTLGLGALSDQSTVLGLNVTAGLNLKSALTRYDDLLPASVALTGLAGAISIEKSGELYPSTVGNLELVADGSITLSSAKPIQLIESIGTQTVPRYFGMIDADPALLPSALNQPNFLSSTSQPLSLQRNYVYIDSQSNSLLHAQTALHGADYEPVRVYSLNGDITTGSADQIGQALVLAPDKAAQIRAGRDIVNLSFLGQHVHDSDVTSLIAGRDILDTALGTQIANGFLLYGTEPSLLLGGPGTLNISAGRNIGPLANQTDVVAGRLILVNQTRGTQNAVQLGSAPLTGINAIGNLLNPYLPHRSADIAVSFGVAPGTAQDAFIDRYINPANAAALTDLPGFSTELIDFVRQYERGLAVDTGFVKDVPALPPALSAADAYTAFRALPDYVQRLFVNQVLFDVLRITAADFGNPNSPYANQYARGYQALSTLFPSSLGYTANNLLGGANGATSTVSTGDLDLRGTTIQTQQGGVLCGAGDLACTLNTSLGGNISILGPGGQAIVGSTSAPPITRDANGNTFAGPGTQGILTLEQGGIDIFTDRSLLLAQSRVFTEQGGSILIWSSNGDVNAGRGARTTADTPAPSYLCNNDFYCIADARGAVTGAGIATLQTVPGAPSGDVFLVAPRGTVDAGDAGIRVSGNLVVAAQAVANADNIQVQGSAIGLKLTAIDSGTLSAGSQAAAAAQQQAASLTSRPVDRASTVITVEVYGFGVPDEQQKKKLRGGSN